MYKPSWGDGHLTNYVLFRLVPAHKKAFGTKYPDRAEGCVQLMLVRLGAPTWLSIIIVSWGIVATSFAGLNGVAQFYALRLLLGITESGTFPGMW